ncbi:MAG TPA: hypothetical protein VME47_18400 [Acetobacteraceae bacterium]|nr:hypothetical protein [Acetobacteraceae bacterium]
MRPVLGDDQGLQRRDPDLPARGGAQELVDLLRSGHRRLPHHLAQGFPDSGVSGVYLVRQEAGDLIDDKARAQTVERHAWLFLKENLKGLAVRRLGPDFPRAAGDPRETRPEL